ncbi:MAG: hypothetical protein CBD27_02245 [Rhodospirillaceae bacterium TMED167]|nr:hypothetical protein [Rhodospirillaceae bacterium]OUW30025.1 MAG: hypothetical protein CBD27_02245 [Rhodospirillaceae bacterium TMED167]
MNVLLTGAQGFCGGHLRRSLRNSAHTLWATARTWDTPSEIQPGYKTLETDFSDFRSLPKYVDVVVHTAASLSVGQATEIDFQRNNIDLTHNLVNYAIDAGARLFIFFSAISVYGSIGSSIVREETPCNDPDPYSLSKLESEAYLAENQNAISSLSLRLPSVVGPGAKYGWLTGVVTKMRRNDPVTFVNPDTLFNNAVHIDDLAHFIDRLIASPPTGAAAINLSLDGQMPVADLLSSLKSLLQSDSALTATLDAAKPGFMIDSTLGREKFGWRSMAVEPFLKQLAADGASEI